MVTDKDLQKIIAGVLKYGVLIVLTLAIIGGIIFLIEHGQEPANFSEFKEKDTNIFEIINSIFEGVLAFEGRAIIFLAVLVLFFTPLLRLILSLFSFILEKDKLYVVITLLVILIIGLSITFGFSH